MDKLTFHSILSFHYDNSTTKQYAIDNGIATMLRNFNNDDMIEYLCKTCVDNKKHISCVTVVTYFIDNESDIDVEVCNKVYNIIQVKGVSMKKVDVFFGFTIGLLAFVNLMFKFIVDDIVVWDGLLAFGAMMNLIRVAEIDKA